MEPNDLDALKREPLDGDSHAASITAYQAQKCAAILEAYTDGQTLYWAHLNTVAQFLKSAALEAALGRGYSRPAADSIWQELDQLAWPRHGRPQPQAD